MSDAAKLLPFASTPRQREILEAVQKHGGQRAAARALGASATTVDATVQRVRRNALQKGWSPEHDMTHPAPDGYLVKGVSTLYTQEGIAAQWVKTDIDHKRMMELATEVIASLSSEIKREKPTKAPARVASDLLNFYPIADYHLGMMAWGEETGADWDTKIAEDMLVAWFGAAIASSPGAAVGLLGLMGDFVHWDGLEAVTPEHRNILDADTRFEKLVRVVIRVIRRVVRMLLGKHERVHIIIAEGNHDPASSAWLRELFAALYEEEPRITVDQSPDPYYCYEWGDTSLFVHHGHRRTVANVADVFAGKFRDVFGRTKHSYAHLGHKHDSEIKETNLMLVERHRTLAASDAYASRGGWLSGRGASVITYSRLFGEVGRVVIGPEMCRTTESAPAGR